MKFIRHYNISTALLLSTLLMSGPVVAGENRLLQINDLRYGEALYHFYQDRYFTAITDLMVAQETRPITKQGADPDLLLGGLYLYYGLHDNADNIFSNLIRDNTSQQVQDRAWFNIGKMRYLGGLYNEAESAFNNIRDALSEERNAERYNLLANTYLKQQKYTEAASTLAKLQHNPDWQTYAKFNIGVSMIKAGQTVEGTQQLAQISQLATDDVELKALKDKANVALGYAYIRSNQPQLAAQYLSNVRLQGPLTSKALLGLGWSQQQQGNNEAALVPWLELRGRHKLDTAVQESLLAIPYTLEKMNRPDLALQHYKNAVENFQEELDSLSGVINAVKGGELLIALRPAMMREDAMAPEYRNKLPETISIPYLNHLINSTEFQQAHKTYLDLLFLKHRISYWQNQFPAYRLMLKERRERYQAKFSGTKNDTRLHEIHGLQKQYDQFANKLATIENNEDALALATEDEQDTLEQLNQVKHVIERVARKQDMSEEQEKYRMFYGILYWDIATDFAPRLWQAKKNLLDTEQALVKSKQTLASLQTAKATAPKSFDGFNQRINKQQDRLKAIISKIDSIINQHEQRIQQQALASLTARYHQIENYHIRARFSLARLYDSMTLNKGEQQ